MAAGALRAIKGPSKGHGRGSQGRVPPTQRLPDTPQKLLSFQCEKSEKSGFMSIDMVCRVKRSTEGVNIVWAFLKLNLKNAWMTPEQNVFMQRWHKNDALHVQNAQEASRRMPVVGFKWSRWGSMIDPFVAWNGRTLAPLPAI
eukprot:1161225-Pelagomonas_calceolata.AAC.22